ERGRVGHAANAVGAKSPRHFDAPSSRRVPAPAARISTVTCTLPSLTGDTASGSASPTFRVTLLLRPATSTGAVWTLSRASIVDRGPFTWTAIGSTRTAATRWPGAGTPRTSGTTRSVASDTRASRHHPANPGPDRCAHVGDGQRDELIAVARAAEIDQDTDRVRAEARARPAGDGDLHVGGLARRLREDQIAVDADVLDRHGDGDERAVAGGHHRPADRGDDDRQELERPITQDPAHDRWPSASRLRRPGAAESSSAISSTSRRRSAASSTGDSIAPSTASEMRAVSSETTTATASVSSLIPSAARWRLPCARATSAVRESGRKHPAAEMRAPSTSTAPSSTAPSGTTTPPPPSPSAPPPP